MERSCCRTWGVWLCGKTGNNFDTSRWSKDSGGSQCTNPKPCLDTHMGTQSHSLLPTRFSGPQQVNSSWIQLCLYFSWVLKFNQRWAWTSKLAPVKCSHCRERVETQAYPLLQVISWNGPSIFFPSLDFWSKGKGFPLILPVWCWENVWWSEGLVLQRSCLENLKHTALCSNTSEVQLLHSYRCQAEQRLCWRMSWCPWGAGEEGSSSLDRSRQEPAQGVLSRVALAAGQLHFGPIRSPSLGSHMRLAGSVRVCQHPAGMVMSHSLGPAWALDEAPQAGVVSVHRAGWLL